jgi:hypothetical protein
VAQNRRFAARAGTRGPYAVGTGQALVLARHVSKRKSLSSTTNFIFYFIISFKRFLEEKYIAVVPGTDLSSYHKSSRKKLILSFVFFA